MTVADAWDPVWDDVFGDREWGRYPPEDLVRFIARNFYRASDRSAVRILETGCGPGANLWFLAREGFSASGIDGSGIAIQRAGTRLAREGLAAELLVGDINQLADYYQPASFDAVIDICCLQHAAEDPGPVVAQVHDLLKPGGQVFFEIVASGTWGDGLGRQLAPGTFTDIAEGPMAGVGRVRFFSRDEVAELFAGFAQVEIESLRRSADNGRQAIDHWLVIARKA